jgi:hypothetical protein
VLPPVDGDCGASRRDGGAFLEDQRLAGNDPQLDLVEQGLPGIRSESSAPIIPPNQQAVSHRHSAGSSLLVADLTLAHHPKTDLAHSSCRVCLEANRGAAVRRTVGARAPTQHAVDFLLEWAVGRVQAGIVPRHPLVLDRHDLVRAQVAALPDPYPPLVFIIPAGYLAVRRTHRKLAREDPYQLHVNRVREFERQAPMVRRSRRMLLGDFGRKRRNREGR